MNDEEIIKLFEARDEKGISAAGERYGKLLRSVARGILRSAETLPIEELAEYIGGSGDAADRLSERELTGLLNGFLRGQDKTTRVIFMRRFWFGDTTAGIAERLHVSESMVKSRISRTLKKLREYLRKEGYDL